MKKILISLSLICYSSISAITIYDTDVCDIMAKSLADSKKDLLTSNREQFIKAMKYMCSVDPYSFENYDRDIKNLSDAIPILENIQEAKEELKSALNSRAKKNMYKTYAEGYINTNACWKAIYDYSQLIEYEENVIYILNRGKLYYAVGKYDKSCGDLKRAAELGEREAKNLLDKYDCY